MVIWLVGLSGSGKTTIGKEVYKTWKPLAHNTLMVDGDDIRQIFQQDKDPANFTLEGRRRNALRIQEICAWLDRQNINVVCCILCLFDDVMRQNRNLFSSYYQVYLNASIDLLKKRDPKGIYAKARQGIEKNIVGIDIEFPTPPDSDLVIEMDNNPDEPEVLAVNILRSAGVIK